jgi:DNA-binding HxlR family transcriptional regulator
MGSLRVDGLGAGDEVERITCVSQVTFLMPSSTPDRRSGCPISISLEIFGDRWSLLIVRDLMFKGLRSFREFAAAGEGVATNVLADRLERLETAGIIRRTPDPQDGRKVGYRLTRKGMELAPVLVEMVLWAARHEDTHAPAGRLRAMRNREAFLDSLWKEWNVEESRARRRPAGVRAARQRPGKS